MKTRLVILNLLLFFSCFSQSNSDYQKTWSTYFGGQGTRIINSVTDSDKNIIVAGVIIGGSRNALQDQVYYNQFATTANPAYLYNPAIVSTTGTYSYQSVIAKFSPAGNLLQSVYLPMDVVLMKINKNDELYISGTTAQDSIGTAGVWMPNPLTGSEHQKAMITKLNTDFTINWLSYVPVSNYAFFALDSNDNIYALANTKISGSITTSGTFQPGFITKTDLMGIPYDNGYLFKLNNLGQLQWATYYGLITPLAISYNNEELVVSLGVSIEELADSGSYYFTPDAYQQTPSAQVISKFNAATGQRIYSTFLGNNNLTITQIVSKDSTNYMLGDVSGSSFSDTTMVNPGAFQYSFSGVQDIYLGKFNSIMVPVWGTYIGGDDYEETIPQSDLILKEDGLYFNAYSYSEAFINTTNTYQVTNQGDGDLFMMKFSKDGQPIWGSFFGGSNPENYGSVIPVDDNLFYWVGETYSQDYISTPGSYQQNMSINPSYSSFGLGNGFVAKFAPESLGIEDHPIGEISVFPNPASGSVTIQLNSSLQGISGLFLYNMLGQCLLTQKLNFTTKQTINLDFLPPGIYYVVIENKKLKKPLQKKIVID